MALALVAGGVALVRTTDVASADPAADGAEAQLLTLLNAARQSSALPPLSADSAIASVARAWSGHMAAVHARTGDPAVKPDAPTDCEQSSLCHRPDLATALAAAAPGWTRAAENIAVAGDVATVNSALLASPAHLANIMGDYTRVGIGVVFDGPRVWATFDFSNSPAPAAPSSSVPVVPSASAPVAVISTQGRYHPVSPVRMADTRDGLGIRPGAVAAGTVVQIPVAGIGPVPANAVGAVVNITAAGVQQPGYLTAFPCGSTRPGASNLNVAGGEVRANLASVALDATRSVCIFSSTTADVVVDLAGWYGTTGDRYQPLGPSRAFDSRAAGGAGTQFVVPITGLPQGASAVTVNLTVANPVGAGFLTAYPCGMPVPLVSNVNFSAGETIANLATVRLGQSGSICLFSSAPSNVIVDLAGAFAPQGGTFTSAVPSRFLDTRDGTGGWLGRAGAGQQLEVQVAGVRGVPAGATSAVVNITVTDPSGPGYVTAYPCDQPRPTVSNLNFDAGSSSANLASVPLSARGTLCLVASTPTHLIADLAGWYMP